MLWKLIKIRLKSRFSSFGTSKKKKSSKGKIVGMAILAIYCLVVFFGLFGALFDSLALLLNSVGLDWGYFAIGFVLAFVVGFVMVVFLCYQELYQAKDNELLMSLPLKPKDILLSRIFSVLLFCYVMEALVLLPCLVMYLLKYSLPVLGIINFIILFITLGLLIIALSSLVAYIFALIIPKLGRLKNVVTIVLFIAVFGLYMWGVFALQSNLINLLYAGVDLISAIKDVAPTIYYLGLAVTNGDMLGLLLNLLVFVLPFIIMVYVLSHNYVNLANAKPKIKKRIYRETKIKGNGAMSALVKREIKHYTSNAMVTLNALMGIIFEVIVLILIIINLDKITMVLEIEELRPYLLAAALVVIIYVSSLNIMSSSMISIEGETLYILKSLPLKTKTILWSKFLAHFVVCTPLGVVVAIVLSFVLKFGILEVIALIFVPMIFTAFIDLLGLLMNLLKPKFDWINEVYCVKQGLAAGITIFAALGIMFLIIAIYIWLFSGLDINLYVILVSIVFFVLDILLALILNSWGVKRFESL